MKRRTFLKAGLSYLPVTFGLNSLTGCSSSSTDPVLPNTCRAASFSKGLEFASADTISKISTIDEKTFGYVLGILVIPIIDSGFIRSLNHPDAKDFIISP